MVADRAVRRRVVHENRVGDIDDRAVPKIDCRAVSLGNVPAEIRTGNRRRRALVDEDAAAVRARGIVDKRRINHRQIGSGGGVNRAAELAGIRIRNQNGIQRQISLAVNRAPHLFVETARDRQVRQRDRARGDHKRALVAAGVDRDPAAGVDRDRFRRADRNRTVGQGDRTFQIVGEGDRHRRLKRFGIRRRLAQRGQIVVGVDHIVEGGHHQRRIFGLDDFAPEDFVGRRDVVPRHFARNGVGNRDVVDARFGRGKFTRPRNDHLVVEGRNLADDDLRVGAAVVVAADDRRAGNRQLKRRDRAGHFIDFLFARLGADGNPECVTAGVAESQGVGPGFAVCGILNRSDRTVEGDRSLIFAVKDDRRAVSVGDLLQRAQIERAAVVAVVPRRVGRGGVIGGIPGVGRLIVPPQRVAVGGKKITAVVFDEVDPERDVRKVVVAADDRVVTEIHRLVAVDHDAVVEEERGVVGAADRAARVVRDRDVRRRGRPARSRKPLLVSGNHHVGQRELTAVVADRAVRSRVVRKEGVGDIDNRAVPNIDRTTVSAGRVSGKGRTADLRLRALVDKDTAAVSFGRVVDKGRVDHGQAALFRRVNRAAEFAGKGVGDKNVLKGQIARAVNGAPFADVIAVFERQVREGDRAGTDLKNAAVARRVDGDVLSAVDGDPVDRIDAQRAAGKRDLTGKPLGEGDRRGAVKCLGVGDRLADRGQLVRRVDDVFEGRHDKARVVGLVGGAPRRGGQKGTFFETFKLETTIFQEIHGKTP